MADQRVIVISDLHLADSRGCGLFDADEMLIQFIGWIEEGPPAHLIVAGDCFELLSNGDEAPSLPFNALGATKRLQKIASCHDGVFESIRRLGADERFSISILGGNHDVEIGIPEALAYLRRKLGPSITWLVHGEALQVQVGNVRMLVEHGDLYDDWNRVSYGPLIVDGRLASRGLDASAFTPPAGSSVVVSIVEPLRCKYWPWVSWLKPEREALLPILHYLLEPKERMKLLGAVSKIMLSGWSAELRQLLPSRSRRDVRSSPLQANSYTFRQWLEDTQNAATRSKVGAAEDRLIQRLRKVATSDGFFDLTDPDQTLREVERRYRSSDIDLIVYGHTHSAKAISSDGRQLYVNTGTWCPLLKLPEQEQKDSDWENFLETLRTNAVEPMSRPTFIEISSVRNRTSVQLCQFSTSGPDRVSQWTKSANGNWHQEKAR